MHTILQLKFFVKIFLFIEIFFYGIFCSLELFFLCKLDIFSEYLFSLETDKMNRAKAKLADTIYFSFPKVVKKFNFVQYWIDKNKMCF